MAYTTETAIIAEITSEKLNDALDDNGDGVADDGILTQIIANADAKVDGYLEGLYSTPLSTVPSGISTAALMFACEAIFRRRAVDKNPYAEKAGYWEKRLEKIGAGEIPLDADMPSDAEIHGAYRSHHRHFKRDDQDGL